jgi:hypothetical protein
MLEFTLNKHHTGLTLWGDYRSLRQLHELIHTVVEGSVVIEDKEGFMLGLAYDVRKAQEGQRLKRKSKEGPEPLILYGVEILWPVILVQVGLLRHAMGFLPTSKRDHATMYDLEYVIEAAIDQAVGPDAEELIEWIPRLGAAPYPHLDSVLNSRCIYFIKLPPKKRLRALIPLLESFDPLFDYFSESGPEKTDRIPASEFAGDDDEWPTFEW